MQATRRNVAVAAAAAACGWRGERPRAKAARARQQLNYAHADCCRDTGCFCRFRAAIQSKEHVHAAPDDGRTQRIHRAARVEWHRAISAHRREKARCEVSAVWQQQSDSIGACRAPWRQVKALHLSAKLLK